MRSEIEGIGLRGKRNATCSIMERAKSGVLKTSVSGPNSRREVLKVLRSFSPRMLLEIRSTSVSDLDVAQRTSILLVEAIGWRGDCFVDALGRIWRLKSACISINLAVTRTRFDILEDSTSFRLSVCPSPRSIAIMLFVILLCILSFRAAANDFTEREMPPISPSSMKAPTNDTLMENRLQIQCDAVLYGQNLKVPSCRKLFGLIVKDDAQLTFAERFSLVPYDLPLPYRIQSSQSIQLVWAIRSKLMEDGR